MKKLTVLALWLFGLGFLFVAVEINEPYLISLRGLGTAGLLVTSAVVVIVLIKQGCWNGRGVAAR
jgi:beta-N-acetylhexosaminidase